jgi:hypothetical protein
VAPQWETEEVPGLFVLFNAAPPVGAAVGDTTTSVAVGLAVVDVGCWVQETTSRRSNKASTAIQLIRFIYLISIT